MSIKLSEFRIRNFRCIDDSDWIKVEDITALVGINESGKTAVLHALRTLNPGSGISGIQKVRDFPRSRLSSDFKEDSIVAQGKFLILNDYLEELEIRKEFSIPEEHELILTLTSRYNNKLDYDFNIELEKKFFSNINNLLKETRSKINRKSIEAQIIEKDLNPKEISEQEDKSAELESKNVFIESTKEEIISALDDFLEALHKKYEVTSIFFEPSEREEFAELLDEANRNLGKYFNIVPVELKDFLDLLEDIISEMKDKSEQDKLFERIKNDIPVFIYFEDYKILSGSIDISNLVKAINGDVKFKEFEIQRTVFEHVNLDPNEIYKLGPRYLAPEQESQLQQRISSKNISAKEVTEEFYAKVSEEKKIQLKERKILLDSASQLMTRTLNQYFQERNYRVEYDTDGQFLQILIWDEKRPSKINLEERSKGFRWYFSFFLVFLVESAGMHKNAILLLDEPGIHLHLQAQFNLINFFQKLKDTNQIIYTTHSPFLIDENHLEQVRSVFEDEDGITHITENNLIPDKKSIFPLQAALSYKTSQVIYQGLKQLLVEGASDFNYIKSINYILEKIGKKSLDKDIVIIPCKSASKIDMYARLFIDLENVPVVLLDSDAEGKRAFGALTEKLFSKNKKNVLKIGDFLKKSYDTEIEDFIGRELLVDCINKNNITKSPVSLDEIEDGTFVDKLGDYCHKNKISFKDKLNWKYEISLKFKNSILSEDSPKILNKITPEKLGDYENLIRKINQYAKKKVD